MKVQTTLRIAASDAHYGGNLVDGAYLLQLFGDLATEICIRHDGDEGLFRAYTAVEFLAPLHVGDFVEATAELVEVGRTSRRLRFTATKLIVARPDLRASAAEVLASPVTVATAEGVVVVPLECQRPRGDV